MGAENMTAAEILRKAAELCEQKGETAGCALRCAMLESDCDDVSCCECGEEIYSKLADKIKAEVNAARSESLRQGAVLWAKANGWPEFREGEDFGAWLDRCTLPRLRTDSGKVVHRREGCTAVAVGFTDQGSAGAVVRGDIGDLLLANAEIGAAIIEGYIEKGALADA